MVSFSLSLSSSLSHVHTRNTMHVRHALHTYVRHLQSAAGGGSSTTASAFVLVAFCLSSLVFFSCVHIAL